MGPLISVVNDSWDIKRLSGSVLVMGPLIGVLDKVEVVNQLSCICST